MLLVCPKPPPPGNSQLSSLLNPTSPWGSPSHVPSLGQLLSSLLPRPGLGQVNHFPEVGLTGWGVEPARRVMGRSGCSCLGVLCAKEPPPWEPSCLAPPQGTSAQRQPVAGFEDKRGLIPMSASTGTFDLLARNVGSLPALGSPRYCICAWLMGILRRSAASGPGILPPLCPPSLSPGTGV